MPGTWAPSCSPGRALDAEHSQVLGAVQELAPQLLVLQHRLDVAPVMLGDRPTHCQVIAVTCKAEKLG